MAVTGPLPVSSFFLTLLLCSYQMSSARIIPGRDGQQAQVTVGRHARKLADCAGKPPPVDEDPTPNPFANCEAPNTNQGLVFVSDFLVAVVEGALDEMGGAGIVVSALLEAGWGDKEGEQYPANCTLASVQQWVVNYVQQVVDETLAQGAAGEFHTFQQSAKTAMAYENASNSNFQTHLTSTAWDMMTAQSSFISMYLDAAPVQILPYMIAYTTLGLQLFRWTYLTNCTFFQGAGNCQPASLAVSLSLMNNMTNHALTAVQNAVQSGYTLRQQAVNNNLASKTCPQSAADWSSCNWALQDNWYANPNVYEQDEVLVVGEHYNTPAQYFVEYQNMVTTNTWTQLQAIAAPAENWKQMDYTVQWNVTQYIGNLYSPLFGMWSTTNDDSLSNVQAQISVPAGSPPSSNLVYTPPYNSALSKYMLQSITVYTYNSVLMGGATWQTSVVAMAFEWFTPAGFSSGVIGKTNPYTGVQSMTMAPGEYVVSVFGVTGGLDLGVQFINLTTNFGRSLAAGSPYPDGTWNAQPGQTFGDNFPVTPFYTDFSSQPKHAEVWLCGAYGFSTTNSVLNEFPSGGARGTYWGNKWNEDYSFSDSILVWPALSTIGFNWCWNKYSVTPLGNK